MKKLILSLLVMIFVILMSGCQTDESYIITFDSSDSTLPDDIEVRKGDSVNLNDYVPDKEGYVFLGWTAQEDWELLSNSIQIVYVDEDIVPTSDTRLTAIFKLDPDS